jgi:hypothetical protein
MHTITERQGMAALFSVRETRPTSNEETHLEVVP